MRVDGAAPRRLWPPAGGGLCSLRSGDDSACGAEGCGIALWAMSFISRLRRSRQHRVSILSAYLVHPFPLRGTSPQGETRALRDWLSVSYGMISTLVISRCAAPLIRLRRTFPPSGGQNKTPRSNLPICNSIVSTGYSATACGGKVVATATKGGAFSRPQGGCMVFAAKGGIKNGAEDAVPPQWARSANQ